MGYERPDREDREDREDRDDKPRFKKRERIPDAPSVTCLRKECGYTGPGEWSLTGIRQGYKGRNVVQCPRCSTLSVSVGGKEQR
jgi:hypothetical protein